jgi:hypothetical protein
MHVVSMTQTQRGPTPGFTVQKQPPASHIEKHATGLAAEHGAPTSVNSSQMLVTSVDASPGPPPSLDSPPDLQAAKPAAQSAQSGQTTKTAKTMSAAGADERAPEEKRLIASARYPASVQPGTFWP